MTKWTKRPRQVSFAITPPMANSISSGCAAKTSSLESLVCDVCVGVIGAVNGITVNVSNFGSFIAAQILLLAGAGNVMCAVEHRLHPAQPCIARGTDLLFGEIHPWQRL